MAVNVEPHPWSSETLLAKARLTLARMTAGGADETNFALWSAVTLELLARASLARFSPVLLADEGNWRNLTYALGRDTTSKKFQPKSIGTREVLMRLAELNPQVTQEIVSFCASHFDRRNSELHTGELAYRAYGSSTWLPRFYQAADVLLASIELKVEDFFDDPAQVRSLIESLGDRAAQSVKADVEAYATVWTRLSDGERDLKRKQAELWSMKQSGHRVACPACGCQSLVVGTGSGPVSVQIDEDEVEQKQWQVPSSFECVACGLRVSGFSKLAACSLGNAFTATSRVTAAEYFGLFTEDDLSDAQNEGEKEAWRRYYEPDFNE